VHSGSRLTTGPYRAEAPLPGASRPGSARDARPGRWGFMLGTYVGRVSGTRLLTWGRAWLRACRLRLAWLRRTAAAMEAGVPIEPRERVLASVREVGGTMVGCDRACNLPPGRAPG